MITLSEAVRLFRLSGDDYLYLFPKGGDPDADFIWMRVSAVRRRFHMKRTTVHSIRETTGTGNQGVECQVAAFEITGRYKTTRRGRHGKS